MTYTPTQGAKPDVPEPRAAAPRRRAWVETTLRLRTAATTEPGRLRLIGAALAVLVVAFGAVTAWQITDRSTAADHVLHHSAPLSADAAEIYRLLADADARVSGGFLAGGQEPPSVAELYQQDITQAAGLITQAAASGDDSREARAQLTKLNEQLPYYTGLVSTAQADNRQGLPLGGAYLRYADEQMQKKGGLLATAGELYRIENDRLNRDYADAKALPWGAWVLGALVLATLVWAQRRHYRRTNRVFNQGMLAASAACAIVLVWLVAGHTVARAKLSDSYTHGAESLQVLNNARIGVLQARGNENLTLVARGSGDSYEDDFNGEMVRLAGKDPRSTGGELAQALALADSSAGSEPLKAAASSMRTWRARHTAARAADDKGDYTTAVALVIGGKDSSGRTVTDTTGECFEKVDADLNAAVDQEHTEFQRAADDGRGAMSLLPAGAAALAVLAAAGAALGIGRRLSEYR
ncbi:hypothetical protein OG552_12045 [Streptomyces sp. NBC_01476]|uniref:hypothetical protein n=1 Tax=Streptomyces sp. NBC_01476 TaxID=2903881 RepID=UPI002E2F3CD4|nr:hypothetical protein [Streptomyces sp. NBC_01476]